MPAQREKKSKQLDYADPEQALKDLFIKVEEGQEAQAADSLELAEDLEQSEEQEKVSEASYLSNARKDAEVSQASTANVFLAQLLQNSSGPFPQEESIKLIIQACELNLAPAYQNIDPAMIILSKNLSEDDCVLGFSKSVVQDVYMAPEIINSDEATGRSAVYSLGVILYEMLSNKDHSAAQNQDFSADIGKWLAYSPSWGTLSTGLKQIIRNCLYPDASLRYESPADLKDALENYLRPHARTVVSVGQPANRNPIFPRRKGPLILFTTLCLAFLAGYNGILPPRNLPLPPPAIDAAPVIDSAQDKAPLASIATGTFIGNVSYDYRTTLDETVTTLRRAPDGTLEGEYSVNEPGGKFEGTLRQISEENGEVKLEWTDKYGSGNLFIRSNGDGSFTGYWGTTGGRTVGTWTGTLQ